MLLETKQLFTNRSRMAIIANLLACSIGGSRKTKLIYKCNLNVAQFNKYADRLIEGGLLEKKIQVVQGRKAFEVYHTSKKGIQFLRDYHRLDETINEIIA